MTNRLHDVVAAALRVLDAYGLEFCSMRRVAAELEVQPSALYHHVADKQTLLALMADEIVSSVQFTEDVRASCHRLRAAMLSVRDGAEVVAAAFAFGLGVREVPQLLTDRLGSAAGAQALLFFVLGHTQSTQVHRQAAAVGAIAPDETLDESFGRGLEIILAGIEAAELG